MSRQIGLFCIFLELRSFFPVELVPQTHTLAFVEKYDSIFVEMAIKTSHVQKFFFDKMERNSEGSDLLKEKLRSPCI